MNPNTGCIQHIDPERNFGKTSGKKFAIIFKRREDGNGVDSVAIFQDGTTQLMKEHDDTGMIACVQGIRAKMFVLKPFKDLEW